MAWVVYETVNRQWNIVDMYNLLNMSVCKDKPMKTCACLRDAEWRQWCRPRRRWKQGAKLKLQWQLFSAKKWALYKKTHRFPHLRKSQSMRPSLNPYLRSSFVKPQKQQQGICVRNYAIQKLVSAIPSQTIGSIQVKSPLAPVEQPLQQLHSQELGRLLWSILTPTPGWPS